MKVQERPSGHYYLRRVQERDDCDGYLDVLHIGLLVRVGLRVLGRGHQVSAVLDGAGLNVGLDEHHGV